MGAAIEVYATDDRTLAARTGPRGRDDSADQHRITLPWPIRVVGGRPHVGGGEIFVRVIGRLEVRRIDQRLIKSDIGSRKARLLLALLALEHGSLVRQDRIVDIVWGAELLPRDPAHNIATMVSRIRRTLGGDSVVGDRAGYRLGATVRVDLGDAAALVAKTEVVWADREPHDVFTVARRALRMLSRGGVLDDEPHELWAEPARVRHRDLLRRARHSVARSALQLDDSATALEAAGSALAADPLDEIACRLLMRAYDASGEPVRALHTFHRLRARLADELGLDPAAATRELHVAILRGQTSPDRDGVRTVD